MIKYCINEVDGKASVLIEGKYLNNKNKLVDTIFYWGSIIEASEELLKYIKNKA